jgi:hypothetical protein
LRRGLWTALLLQELHDPIALFRLDGAKLAFDINTELAAQSNKIFALHAQLSRQDVNANFLVNQAELPCADYFGIPTPPAILPIVSAETIGGWSVTLSSVPCHPGLRSSPANE